MSLMSTCKFSDAILIKMPTPCFLWPKAKPPAYQEKGSLHYHHFQREVGQKEFLINQKHQKADEGEGGHM
jgi:hypothetical protein